MSDSPLLDVIADFLSPFSRRQRSLLIMGVGQTGQALGNLFRRYQIPFSLYDQDLSLLTDRLILWQPYLEKYWDNKTVSDLLSQLPKFTDVLLSPGIPRNTKVVLSAERYSKVWNEIDFFYPLFQDKILIGITGTDGKSTTVELTQHVLRNSYSSLTCGNNGTPLANVLEKVCSPSLKVLIIEFSSYMLEKLYRFRANFIIILNITPDHLDRYDNFIHYLLTKQNLLRYALASDIYIKNLDDPYASEYTPSLPQLITYSQNPTTSLSSQSLKHYFLQENTYYCSKKSNSEKKLICYGSPNSLSTVLFPGNIFPAIIIAQELGIKGSLIERQIQSFIGLPHRLEKVNHAHNLGRENITTYNNSKATTLQSVINSIDYLYKYHQKPLHIILGGKPKNVSFQTLLDYRDKIKKAYFYGAAGKTIQNQSKIPGFYNYDFLKVVEQALQEITKEEILVLSPGCSSFDQFSNFEERGEVFKKIVTKRN